jgi:hypothetical protein
MDSRAVAQVGPGARASLINADCAYRCMRAIAHRSTSVRGVVLSTSSLYDAPSASAMAASTGSALPAATAAARSGRLQSLKPANTAPRAAVGRPHTTIHSRCNSLRFVPIGSGAITRHINFSIRQATSRILMASATEHEPRAHLNHGSAAVPRQSSRIFQRGLPRPWDRGSHCASSAPTLRRICAHRRVCRRR